MTLMTPNAGFEIHSMTMRRVDTPRSCASPRIITTLNSSRVFMICLALTSRKLNTMRAVSWTRSKSPLLPSHFTGLHWPRTQTGSAVLTYMVLHCNTHRTEVLVSRTELPHRSCAAFGIVGCSEQPAGSQDADVHLPFLHWSCPTSSRPGAHVTFRQNSPDFTLSQSFTTPNSTSGVVSQPSGSQYCTVQSPRKHWRSPVGTNPGWHSSGHTPPEGVPTHRPRSAAMRTRGASAQDIGSQVGLFQLPFRQTNSPDFLNPCSQTNEQVSNWSRPAHPAPNPACMWAITGILPHRMGRHAAGVHSPYKHFELPVATYPGWQLITQVPLSAVPAHAERSALKLTTGALTQPCTRQDTSPSHVPDTQTYRPTGWLPPGQSRPRGTHTAPWPMFVHCSNPTSGAVVQLPKSQGKSSRGWKQGDEFGKHCAGLQRPPRHMRSAVGLNPSRHSKVQTSPLDIKLHRSKSRLLSTRGGSTHGSSAHRGWFQFPMRHSSGPVAMYPSTQRKTHESSLQLRPGLIWSIFGGLPQRNFSHCPPSHLPLTQTASSVGTYPSRL
mmetsp:Transcript_72711/g.193965  ORF Transcript_72711/g.193965 Transcript_72711/m.193965 type:complete len:551 (-) Transcript_72711:2355-4007(-)